MSNQGAFPAWLFQDHESPLLLRSLARPPVDNPENGYRTVAVVGGGTAGYLAALALRAQLPHLEVTLIESKSIPIIGVGEATTPGIVPFLHHYLKIDINDFYRAVRPTWKLGIKFEWGLPGDYFFHAPFDWGTNTIGALGSLATEGGINSATLEGVLMTAGVAPVGKLEDGTLVSWLGDLLHAYHLDNKRFVQYLTGAAARAGVRHLDCTIVDAVPTAGGDEIDHLVGEDLRRLKFDLYIDCTGFRSFLLEKQLGSAYHSFASSLFTDSAVTFACPHGGRIKPYTTAKTMDSGWCWNIPMPDSDHLGYVFSSAHCSVAEAQAEVLRSFPGADADFRLVKFRSGRHEEAWKGNVFAVGNSYGFVEPLESTGIFMICREIIALIRAFPSSKRDVAMKDLVNKSLAKDWDLLRWFLSIHYKFNRRAATPFWNEAREKTDVSGIQTAIDVYRESGPLGLQGLTVKLMACAVGGIFPWFGGVAGFDTIMMGQQVPTRLFRPVDDDGLWQRKKAHALSMARIALRPEAALEALRERPEVLADVVNGELGWVHFFGTKGGGWSLDL